MLTVLSCGGPDQTMSRQSEGDTSTGGNTAASDAATGGGSTAGALWDPCKTVTNAAYEECPALADELTRVLPVVHPNCQAGLFRCSFVCSTEQHALLCLSLGGECTLPGHGCRP